MLYEKQESIEKMLKSLINKNASRKRKDIWLKPKEFEKLTGIPPTTIENWRKDTRYNGLFEDHRKPGAKIAAWHINYTLYESEYKMTA